MYNKLRSRDKRSGQYYDSSSSSEMESCAALVPRKIVKKLKSGISAKPTTNVQEQLRYPHYSLGQLPGFKGLNIQYHQLSYDQFIAGKMSTILRTSDSQEQDGHIQLLQ